MNQDKNPTGAARSESGSPRPTRKTPQFFPSRGSKESARSRQLIVGGGRSLGLTAISKQVFIKKIREGLNYGVLEYFSGWIEMSDRELAGYANIPSRTLARRKKEGHFHPDESDRLARLSILFDAVVELFDNDKERAVQWFRTSKKALGGASPIEYANTEPGAQEVRDLIGRLEHGVFS